MRRSSKHTPATLWIHGPSESFIVAFCGNAYRSRVDTEVINTMQALDKLLNIVMKDPSILQAIRKDSATGYWTDQETSSRTISMEVVTLPLLQPVWIAIVKRKDANFPIINKIPGICWRYIVIMFFCYAEFEML